MLDNKGVKGLTLDPHNTELLVPVAHSSLGYTFLFNLPSFGAVEYNDTGSHWRADAVLQADMWVATTADGPAHAVSPWQQLQHSYANATGHAPTYPQWASGFWQSKNRYHNQSQILDVAAGYRSRGLPLALMVIDYYSWAPTPLGDEQLSPACWPDPTAMVDTLADEGVELMISPYFHLVSAESKNAAAALAQGLLVRNGTATATSIGNPTTPATPATAAGATAAGVTAAPIAAAGAALAPARVREFADAYIYDVFTAQARAYAWDKVAAGYVKPYGLHHWYVEESTRVYIIFSVATHIYTNK